MKRHSRFLFIPRYHILMKVSVKRKKRRALGAYIRVLSFQTHNRTFDRFEITGCVSFHLFMFRKHKDWTLNTKTVEPLLPGHSSVRLTPQHQFWLVCKCTTYIWFYYRTVVLLISLHDCNPSLNDEFLD